MSRPIVLLPTATCVHATAGKLILWYPFTSDSLGDFLHRFTVSPSERLMWWTLRLNTAGEFVPPAWLHAHRARYAGLLAVRGEHDPSEHVCNISGCSCDSAGQLQGCPPSAFDVAALRLKLKARTAADLLCYDDTSAPSFELVDADPQDPHHFDRQGRLNCQPHSFEAGDRLTLFVFMRGVWATDLKRFPMHVMLFAHFQPRSQSDDMVERIHEVAPSSYGDWDLTSGVVKRRQAQPMPDNM